MLPLYFPLKTTKYAKNFTVRGLSQKGETEACWAQVSSCLSVGIYAPMCWGGTRHGHQSGG